MMQKWTEEEIADLREMYPDHGTEDVAIVLGRTTNAVTQKAVTLGIKKSAEFMRREYRRIAKACKSTRFAKGHVPWNAGTVGITGKHPNTKKTQFKKGHLPHNTKRNGAITIRNDNRGVPQKMIRVSLGKWVPLARYKYEQYVEPIPKGHVIRFLDGDTMNCEPSNLECVSKRLNMLINSKHSYTRGQAEVKEVCVLINEHINNGSGDG